MSVKEYFQEILRLWHDVSFSVEVMIMSEAENLNQLDVHFQSESIC